MTTSRRSFLRAASGLAGAGLGAHAAPLALRLAGLGALASTQAQAASTEGYKALVCLFMQGGSDQHNWVVPTDSSSYASYAAARGDLAVASSRLQGITSSGQGSGRSFGMPSDLAPLRKWYEAGQAAIVANVGTLARPITKADYTAGVGLPPKLFSHNDQQAYWQALQAEGATVGWGGRFGDALMAANAQPVFTAISTAGNAVFLSGSQVTQYQMSQNGPVLINAAQTGWRAGSTAVPGALRTLVASSSSDAFQAEYLKVVQRSLNTAGTLQTALAASGVAALPSTATTLPSGGTLTLANDSLAKQLRVVAQMMAAAQGLGLKRQVFMVQVGGFDTHSNQNRDQPLLMSRVAHSVDWFMGTLQAAGLLNNVALFTASDFGRTLISNGDGSDHGWGSHHFVLGGGVKGRQIYGNFPTTALGTTTDLGSGRLLPTTSVTQLAASLGAWMGLSNTELATALPSLSSFSGRPAVI